MKKHSKLPRWVLADELMDRWNRNRYELDELIRNFNLPAYRYTERKNELINTNSIFPGMVPNLVFNLTDVEQFEKKHPELLPKESRKEKSLTSEEAIELGRLRTEKTKWNDSIVAAVKAALFCSRQGRPVTRKQLHDELYRLKLDLIPNTTFDRIWKAIPQDLRHLGGAPKKS